MKNITLNRIAEITGGKLYVPKGFEDAVDKE